MAILTKVLETNADARSLTIRTLRRNGYKLDVSVLDMTPTAREDGLKSKAKQAQELRLEKLRQNSHKAVANVKDGTTKEGWLASKYTLLKDFSLVMLLHLLSILEPYSFSEANLTRKTSAGPMTKDVALLIVEYLTGVDAKYDFVGPMRYWPYALSMMNHWSKQRGSRGANLAMPALPNMQLWKVMIKDGRVFVIHNFAKANFELDAATIPAASITHQTLLVKQNYSESNAVLACSVNTGWQGVALSPFVSSHIAQKELRAPDVPRDAFQSVTLVDLKEHGHLSLALTNMTPKKRKGIHDVLDMSPSPRESVPASSSGDATNVTNPAPAEPIGIAEVTSSKQQSAGHVEEMKNDADKGMAVEIGTACGEKADITGDEKSVREDMGAPGDEVKNDADDEPPEPDM